VGAIGIYCEWRFISVSRHFPEIILWPLSLSPTGYSNEKNDEKRGEMEEMDINGYG